VFYKGICLNLHRIPLYVAENVRAESLSCNQCICISVYVLERNLFFCVYKLRCFTNSGRERNNVCKCEYRTFMRTEITIHDVQLLSFRA